MTGYDGLTLSAYMVYGMLRLMEKPVIYMYVGLSCVFMVSWCLLMINSVATLASWRALINMFMENMVKKLREASNWLRDECCMGVFDGLCVCAWGVDPSLFGFKYCCLRSLCCLFCFL